MSAAVQAACAHLTQAMLGKALDAWRQCAFAWSEAAALEYMGEAHHDATRSWQAAEVQLDPDPR